MRLAQHDPAIESESELQSVLKRIFASVITEKKVGLDDDFFDLGLSSIALAQAFERIDEEYPGQLDIEDLFDKTSIRAIAAYIESKMQAGSSA